MQHFFLDDDEPPAAGSWPDRLAGVRPQGRISAAHCGADCRRPVALDSRFSCAADGGTAGGCAPVCRCACTFCEQVIEVPKIILENMAVRTLVREPQPAELLLEVPTILTPPFIRMLQNVDTPVPQGGRGASGGLQSFLPGQSSSFAVEQIVDNPVSRGGGRRLQGFLQNSATALTVEQDVDIRVPGENLQDLRPGQFCVIFTLSSWCCG